MHYVFSILYIDKMYKEFLLVENITFERLKKWVYVFGEKHPNVCPLRSECLTPKIRME